MIACLLYPKVRKMKAKGHTGKICVVVGTVTDDVRLYDVPALKASTEFTVLTLPSVKQMSNILICCINYRVLSCVRQAIIYIFF